MKKLTIMILITLLASTSYAAKVGVYVEFPDDSSYTKCLSLDEGINAYEILEKTSLDFAWNFHELYGHGLCGIDDVGCPEENCWCSDQYWGFYVLKSGKNSWSYSALGFDGGNSCDEHYCAKEGEVLGFRYGGWGIKPGKISFEDICVADNREIRERTKRQFNVSIKPEKPLAGEKITINVLDETSEGLPDAEIEVYTGKPGYSKSPYSGKVNRYGKAEFILFDAGSYTLRVNVAGYHPPQKTFELYVEATTTTTSTTFSKETSTTQSPTTTSTTSTLAFLPTTTPPSSTTSLPSTTTRPQEVTGQMTATNKSATSLSLIFFMGLGLSFIWKKYISC